MSELLNTSIAYIENAKVGWLITVGENNRPYIRPIGAFSNDGINLYFLTRKDTNKVRHINANSTVTFYFENPNQPFETFKSVAVSGIASEVVDAKEFEKAAEGIAVRYPVIKENIQNGKINDSAIYKIKVNFIKAADYAKKPGEIEEVV